MYKTANRVANVAQARQPNKISQCRRGWRAFRALVRLEGQEDCEGLQAHRRGAATAMHRYWPLMSLQRRADRQMQTTVNTLRLQGVLEAATSSDTSFNSGQCLLQQALVVCSGKALPESLAVSGRQGTVLLPLHTGRSTMSQYVGARGIFEFEQQLLAGDKHRHRASVRQCRLRLRPLCHLALQARACEPGAGALTGAPRESQPQQTLAKDWERRHARCCTTTLPLKEIG